MTQFAVTKPTILVNNNPVAIIPNSCVFDEGKGETNVRNQNAGGGSNEVVVSEDAEQEIGKITFELANTVKNIDLARGWKRNPGLNVVELTGEVGNQSFERVFNSASVTNNYEVTLSADGNIPIEWMGDQPL